jgi:hypothetical protein
MIVTVGTWRGLGGTTAALVLASCMAEQGPAWLVEADPAGGALAGRMRFEAHELGGLERVAFPVERTSPAEAFDRVAHRVGDLRIVSAPADPFRGHACHRPRVPWVPALHDLGGPVVVDIGRLRTGAPTRNLLSLADVVIMVTTPEVSAAVATTEWVHARGRVSPDDAALDDPIVLVVVVDVPGGIAFTRHALQADLASQWGEWLPWEPGTVDLIHRGASSDDRRLRRSPLLHAARRLVRSISSTEVLV